MKSVQNQTAFPAFPIQDNLGKVITPFPGMTKVEYFSMELFKTFYQKYSDSDADDRDELVSNINSCIELSTATAVHFLEVVQKLENEIPETKLHTL